MTTQGKMPHCRSALLVPATGDPAQLAEAEARGADAVIFDLEDTVHASRKDEARNNVARLWSRRDRSRGHFGIRINTPGSTDCETDLRLLRDLEPDFVLVPKVEDAAELRAVVARIREPAHVWLLIETIAAIQRCEEIASATPRAPLLMLGTEDLGVDMMLSPSARQGVWMQQMLMQLGLVARKHDLQLVDGPFSLGGEYTAAALEQSCRQSRDMGATGRLVLQPAQIAAVNDAYGLATAAAEAEHVVRFYEEATARTGRSLVEDGGVTYGPPHYKRAKRLLGFFDKWSR